MTGRVENDHYPTPNWMTESLIKHANIQGSMLECCAGEDLAIAKVFEREERIRKIWTNDFYFDFVSDYGRDATLKHNWQRFPIVEWVITNPPFTHYLPILQHALVHAKVGVAMLLRVTADEMVVSDKNKSRYDWWADNPESLAIKMPRYCFAKSSKSGKFSTDSAYCQWFVWRKDGYQYPSPVIRLPYDRIPNFSRQPIITNE
ncbi:hypothetical protein [Chamaesiphon sp.]|uniref:hypothetical protein n=1 Tax=Chamaesiphon sp. TaxID=2814140 RepID=UPI0035931FBC